MGLLFLMLFLWLPKLPVRAFIRSHRCRSSYRASFRDQSSRLLTDEEVLHHFSKQGNVSQTKVDAYWVQQLQAVRRPAARSLICQLVSCNELGFEGATEVKKGTLLEYVLQQKKKYQNKVILTRVGEFYETYGVDAVMMVNFCGLNAMGGRPKAGCPARNVQATLDGLTDAGLSVAIFEEINDVDINRIRRQTQRIKPRALTQIVSPSSRTYIHDLCLRSEDIDFRDGRPVLGVHCSATGYSISEIYSDERVMILSERLSKEAAKSLIDFTGPAGTVYVQGKMSDFDFLRSYTIEALADYSPKDFHSQVLRRVGEALEVDVSVFRVISRLPSSRPRPLYSSTAAQIGLLANQNIPDLVAEILPKSKSMHSTKFFRRWLLHPPPYKLADSMQSLCRVLGEDIYASLPEIYPVPIGKTISLLLARQSNTALFRDIQQCLEGTLLMLDPQSTHIYSSINIPMAELASYESGFVINPTELYHKVLKICQQIRKVVLAQDEIESDICTSDPFGRIPDTFFVRNELEFRGCVVASPERKEIESAYSKVALAARELCQIVEDDFPSSQEVMYDVHNNLIMFKDNGSQSEDEKSEHDVERVLDRYNKVIPRRLTTSRAKHAISSYINSCHDATAIVKRALQTLSSELLTDITSIVQCSHWAVILEAAISHTIASKRKGWSLPLLVDNFGQDKTHQSPNDMYLQELIPYWLQRGQAVANTLELSGLFLLSAPNMSGKSTLMRSVLVAALLGNCGLYTPVTKNSRMCRYDNFFLRTASYDVPSTGMSSFALEMDDLRVVLRDCTPRSLVMVDELGRGTSSRDGAAIAGALLEHLDSIGTSGIFSTHLHELFKLPLEVNNVKKKKMGILAQEGGMVRWTYKLEDGECEDSMALLTAKHFGLPNSLLRRAETLSYAFDEIYRPPGAKHHRRHSMNKRSIESVQGYEGIMEDVGIVDFEDEVVRNTQDANRQYSLEEVLPLLHREENIIEPVIIEHGWKSPAALEGYSCVYILHVHMQTNEFIYVGETESLSQRLKQHRQSWRAKHIKIRVAAFQVQEGKSRAREIETSLIRCLKKHGYQLSNSDTGGDSTHVLFSGRKLSNE